MKTSDGHERWTRAMDTSDGHERWTRAMALAERAQVELVRGGHVGPVEHELYDRILAIVKVR